jgi:nucleotide-binding universal stress UspA family protein
MNSAKPILVAYDSSGPSRAALRWALEEAGLRDRPVTILHADTPESRGIGTDRGYHYPGGDEQLAAAEALLAGAVALAKEWAPQVAASPQLVADSPTAAVLGVLGDVSMVVLGTRGLNAFEGLLVGSTSLHVATHATVPVVVMRDNGTGGTGPEAGRVVVGVDDSESAQDALHFAFDEASLRKVGVTAIRTWRSEYFDSAGAKGGGAIPAHIETDVVLPAETAALADAVSALRSEYPDVDVRERVVHATAVQALVDASHGAELLVVGSRGRGGFRTLLLGSVSHAVLQHAFSPVAITRPSVTA